MEIVKIIYVAFIEGVKSVVPVEAKALGNNLYIIINNNLYDPEDESSLFQFIPGDKVTCKTELRRDYNGKEEEILVADVLIEPNDFQRRLYMVKFLIVDQNGVLSLNQSVSFPKKRRIQN